MPSRIATGISPGFLPVLANGSRLKPDSCLVFFRSLKATAPSVSLTLKHQETCFAQFETRPRCMRLWLAWKQIECFASRCGWEDSSYCAGASGPCFTGIGQQTGSPICLPLSLGSAPLSSCEFYSRAEAKSQTDAAPRCGHMTGLWVASCFRW